MDVSFHKPNVEIFRAEPLPILDRVRLLLFPPLPCLCSIMCLLPLAFLASCLTLSHSLETHISSRRNSCCASSSVSCPPHIVDTDCFECVPGDAACILFQTRIIWNERRIVGVAAPRFHGADCDCWLFWHRYCRCCWGLCRIGIERPRQLELDVVVSPHGSMSRHHHLTSVGEMIVEEIFSSWWPRRVMILSVSLGREGSPIPLQSLQRMAYWHYSPPMMNGEWCCSIPPNVVVAETPPLHKRPCCPLLPHIAWSYYCRIGHLQHEKPLMTTPQYRKQNRSWRVTGSFCSLKKLFKIYDMLLSKYEVSFFSREN
mmetsp:Transcript_19788/g.42961  ORF Transcript_19788/g.42961 Transcript_19788/m.42961 type:complete len:314 (-) Transcript_19788:102-1043(-)